MSLHRNKSTRLSARFASIFAGGTMLSRVLGLVRDMVVGALVGVGSRDAFILAFKLPNMLRDMLGEGALNAAFVPVFSKSLEREGKEAFNELVSAAMSSMLVVLLVLTAVGSILAPQLLSGLNALKPITGGVTLSAQELELISTLTRWTFPYLFFIGMAVFAMGPLYTIRHYATPSWSPALLNVALILCCLAFRNAFPDPAYALVLGVWLGGVAQLAVLYAALGRRTGVWLPNFKLRHAGVWKVYGLMMPVLVGQAAGEVNKLVDVLFARSLDEGIVSAFYYANRLIQLPLSMFGFAVAVAILPLLSQAAARNRAKEIRDTLMTGFRQSFFLVLPCMLGLVFFGKPLIQLLFEHGDWTPEQTELTVGAMTVYALGLLSFAWVKVGVTGFFCVADTKTPVIVASASMILNILLNIALVRPLGYRGLALATDISYTVNFAALYYFLVRRHGPLWDSAFLTSLLRMTVAGAVMTAAGYAAYAKTAQIWPSDSTPAHLAAVVALLVSASAAYLGACYVLRVEEIGDFADMLRRKSRSERP
ncbi:MAG TPA: murein biosynthesis integral membrane protein MurJ [Candidatus Hydrogenedentes bacterium]|nr:murein biosynthesis integral membrane protein MurJ [Candidatus Hydrogenedentota bacterium]HQH50915.1 murein biosynthesis integral membrane protein MurJ [Candidatus Hydrogenedentota bacterium]